MTKVRLFCITAITCNLLVVGLPDVVGFAGTEGNERTSAGQYSGKIASWIQHELSGSVGQGGENEPDDVLTVQLLLNQIPPESGGSAELLDPDGLMGPRTLAAIERFQVAQFGDDAPDGRVDVSGRTHMKLIELVEQQTLNDRIVRIALGEQLFWRNGDRTELDERVSNRLKQYWEAVGLNYRAEQMRDAEFQSNQPWSAAFVSWVMLRAGAADAFAYSAAHWRYVAAAKANRETNNENPFQAYRPTEVSPSVGDIVVKRRSDSTATYENIANGHKTHGDIVVEVSGSTVVTVGGNVGNSVRVTEVELDARQLIANERYFAIVVVD